MFFFFFTTEYDAIEKHDVFRLALSRVLFSKLYSDGYCDLSTITKCGLSKSDIEQKLKSLDSPLYILYNSKSSFNEDSLIKHLPEILNDIRISLYSLGEKDIDFVCFAIVYYAYRTINKNKQQGQEYLIKLFDRINDSDNLHHIEVIDDIAYDTDRVSIEFVDSLQKYIDLLQKQLRSEDEKLFYRGQSDCSYRLVPSLFRKDEWKENECRMYQELISRCPSDILYSNSYIERLAIMQHYGLPTRLLDVTQNPLIALYFACESNPNRRGEVITFNINKNEIEYSYSEKAELLSTLPLLSYDMQKELYNIVKNEKFLSNTYENFINLNKNIKEVSSESNDILDKTVLYIPAKNNKRIENQDGAFFILGLVSEHYDIEEKRLNVLDKYIWKHNGKKHVYIINNKRNILSMLSVIGINKAKVYPEIDDVADYIKNNVSEL